MLYDISIIVFEQNELWRKKCVCMCIASSEDFLSICKQSIIVCCTCNVFNCNTIGCINACKDIHAMQLFYIS